MEFLAILGATGLMATLDRYNHFTTTIWLLGPKKLFISPKFCLPLFISLSEDRDFGVNSDKTIVDLLTFK
jgi:hypothetical protein